MLEIVNLPMIFHINSTHQEFQTLTENLLFRMIHKVTGSLNSDHKDILMFIFSVNLLSFEDQYQNKDKSEI